MILSPVNARVPQEVVGKSGCPAFWCGGLGWLVFPLGYLRLLYINKTSVFT